jgi:hypothetical protein
VSDGIWSIITLIGLFGWVSSAIVFLFKAFPGRGLFEVRAARLWGAALLVSYAVWVIGLLNA